MPRVCVGILARNNEDQIAECLASAAWADERLVILDTRSSDRTAEIARGLGARVVAHRFEDFGRQREFGLGLPASEWLMYLDSDERITPALAEEVRQVVRDDAHTGWWVPRRNLIWGREIRHGGWYPDYQLRLLRRGQARYDLTRQVHEVVILDGVAGYLREPLIHHNYRMLAEFVAKQRPYAEYEARIRHAQGRHARPWTFLLQPLREFCHRYVRLQGFRDGPYGLLLCLLVAYYYGWVAT
ncbi:MAG: glycosyltransferase family 2 protein, partial [Chloroflexota bacterium]